MLIQELQITLVYVRFHVLTAARVKIRAFLDIAPCSLVGVGRRFRDAYCLHYQGDEGSDLYTIVYAQIQLVLKFSQITVDIHITLN
jgi:hypothetical protein